MSEEEEVGIEYSEAVTELHYDYTIIGIARPRDPGPPRIITE